MIKTDNLPEEERRKVDEENTENENQPDAEIKNQKEKSLMKKFKIAYAFAVVLAVCAALGTKIATEKTLDSLNVPIEQKYTSAYEQPGITDGSTESDGDAAVGKNLTDVPDTRSYSSGSQSGQNKEQNKNEKSGQKAESTEAEKTTAESPYAKPYGGYFTLPSGMKICGEYSDSELVFSKTMGDWRTHPAVDFAADEGAQVKSIAYGTVTAVGNDVLWGCVIEIDHGNGVKAKYCGFNEDTVCVKKGDTVKSGALLGYLGTVPCEKSEGSHLHFEISYNGRNVEPLELMGK